MPTVTEQCSIRITKGCKTLGISKGDTATVVSVTQMGADWGHFVRVVIRTNSKVHTLWARHMNRLSDATVRLHNGDPTKHIEFFVRPAGAVGAVARSIPTSLTIRMTARARKWLGDLKVTTLAQEGN